MRGCDSSSDPEMKEGISRLVKENDLDIDEGKHQLSKCIMQQLL